MYVRNLRSYLNAPIFQAAACLVAGMVLGFILGRGHVLSVCRKSEACCVTDSRLGRLLALNKRELQSEQEDNGPKEDLVFIGVMTARKFLKTRIVAAYDTWAKFIPGRVMFFSSYGSEADLADRPDIPVIGIPGVDDSYPPQKKSFLMLKYMYEHFGDKYQWFIRADDDIYIKGDKLGAFLHSINSTKPQFIGQAGLGNKEELGRLQLKQNQNFCMGGPGIIMSQATLKATVPHVSHCLKNLYTTHEDVEVGRCVGKFAKVSCTWNFEMHSILYHNHAHSQGAFNHPLKMKEIHNALTLHPFKIHTYQYRMHIYLLGRKVWEYSNKISQLRREISQINAQLADTTQPDTYRLGLRPSLSKTKPKTRKELLPWSYFKRSMNTYTNNNPNFGLPSHMKSALDDMTSSVMEMINKNARYRGRTIDFKEILYGYHRVNPLYGADYVLDLLLIYRKHKGARMTVPVRRHAYIQQAFTEIQFSEDEEYPSTNALLTRTQSPPFLEMFQKRVFGFYSSDESKTQLLYPHSPEKTIHFILPLAGRYSTFINFMNNFEDVCLKFDSKTVLAVMLFHSETDDRTEDTIDYIRILQSKYPQHELKVIQMKGQFSRALALQKGSELFSMDNLLFFVDVDIYMSPDSLTRIRKHTIWHKQVYYPIVFSQYDPKTKCDDVECDIRNKNPFYFNDEAGYWRQFGFGIAAMYRSDFVAIGGFDINIKGWGKEDVDLFDRYVLNKNITTFRTADPGLVHIYHAINCDPNLELAQYQMCLGTKSQTFGSLGRLAGVLYNNMGIEKGSMLS